MKKELALLTLGCALLCLDRYCPAGSVQFMQIGDGACDPQCMSLQCQYDGGDCAPQCHCDSGVLGNAQCDEECDVAACGWDMGDCGVCASGCISYAGFSDTIGNGVCDPQCDTSACNRDGGDCVTASNPDVIQVSREQPGFQPLSAALRSVWANFTTVYLHSGAHELVESAAVDTGVVTVTTLLCGELWTAIGCAREPAVVQLTTVAASISVATELRLVNVTIAGGFSLKTGCTAETCRYCPFLHHDSETGLVINDRNEAVDQELYADTCALYHQTTLIAVSYDAVLVIENAVFADIQHQLSSLISSNCSVISLANVNFTNIINAPRALEGATVIHSAEALTGHCGSFHYSRGVVELLNNGYEYTQSAHFSGFLHLDSSAEVSLEHVTFRYNNVVGSALLLIERPAFLSISDCRFEANIGTFAAAALVRPGLAEPASEGDLVAISVVNCSFLSNFAVETAVLSVQFVGHQQSLRIEDCDFYDNGADKGGIVSISIGNSSSYETEDTAGLARGRVALHRLEFLRSQGKHTLYISASETVTMSSLQFTSFTDEVSHALCAAVQMLVDFLPSYMSLVPSCEDPVRLVAALFISDCEEVTLESALFASGRSLHGSAGLSFGRIAARVDVAGVTFANNSGSTLLQLTRVGESLIARCVFEGNSGPVTAQPALIGVEGSVSIAMADCVLRRNTAKLGAMVSFAESPLVTIARAVVVGNEAQVSSAGILFGNFSYLKAAVSVRESTFASNRGKSSGVLTVSNAATGFPSLDFRLSIVLLDSVFSDNTAEEHGTALTVAGDLFLAEDCEVRNCTFANNTNQQNGAAVLLEMISGVLRLRQSRLVGNRAKAGAAVYLRYLGPRSQSSFLEITDCQFSANSGKSVVDASGLFSVQLVTSRLLFSFNTGICVMVSGGQWVDASSTYRYNRATEGVVFTASKGALVSVSDFEAAHNSATSNAGAVRATLESNVTCRNCYFYNNTAGGSGGAVFVSESTVVMMSNITIVRNAAVERGSAIYARQGTLTFIDATIFNNTVTRFGTISILETKLTMQRCTLKSNTAGARTAGLNAALSTISIDSCLFASQKGVSGAFFFVTDTSSMTITRSVVQDCSANSGGVFYITLLSTMVIRHSTIVNSTSATDGSVLTSRICTLTFENVTITSAKGVLGAAALFIMQTDLTLTSCSISNSRGSAVFSSAGSVTIANSTFHHIEAVYGAAVNCLECVIVRISGSAFSHNKAKQGGAIYTLTTGITALSLSAVYANNTFAHNTAVSGGAVFSDSFDVLMVGNEFLNNSAALSASSDHLQEGGFGGAINSICPNLVHCVFNYTGNRFLSNSAENEGGAVRWANSFPILNENTFKGNQALYGGNIAAFPVRLALLGDDGSLQEYIQHLDAGPLTIQLNNIASGQRYEGSIRFALVDQYSHIVTLATQQSAKITGAHGSSLTVFGNVQMTAVKGVFTFANFTATGPPGSTQVMTVTTNGVDPALKTSTRDPSSYYPAVAVLLAFRDCQPGESLEYEQCVPCPENTFSLEPSQPCTSCPSEAICYGTYQMVPRSGYWRPDGMRNLFFQCLYSDACVGSPSDVRNLSLTGNCARGYGGNLCNVCESGYSRSGLGKCSRCPSLASNIGLSTFLAIVAIASMIVLVVISTRTATRSRTELATYLKVLLNYLQIVIVAASLRLTWPAFVARFLSLQKVVGDASDQLLSFDCVFAEFSSQNVLFSAIAMYVALPAVLLTCAAIIWFVLSLFFPISSVFPKVVGSLVLILFLLHTSLTKILLSMFACIELLPGEYWLLADLSVRCWVSEHNREVLSVTLPGLIVWVFGLPLLCLIFLIRSRRKLNERPIQLQFSFLYKNYSDRWFFWEFVIVYRKVILVLASVFLTTVSIMVQALSILAVLLVCLFLQIYFQPYTIREFNQLEVKSILASLVTIYAGMYYESNDMGKFHSALSLNVLLFIVILATNAYFLAAWVRHVLPILIVSLRRKVCGTKHYRVKPSETSKSQLSDLPMRDDSIQRRSPSPLDVEPGSVPNNTNLDEETTTKKGETAKRDSRS